MSGFDVNSFLLRVVLIPKLNTIDVSLQRGTLKIILRKILSVSQYEAATIGRVSSRRVLYVLGLSAKY